MKKRLLSLLLALIMALSLVPVTAFAADDHDGQVHVTVENTTWTKADGAPWEGTLVDEWITLKDDSTMMSCIVDALAAKGYTQTGADTGYISEINGIKEKDRRNAVARCVHSYRDHIRQFSQMDFLDVWYDHLDVEAALDHYESTVNGKRNRTLRDAALRASVRDSDHAAAKLTYLDSGEKRLRFRSKPPELVPISELQDYADLGVLRERLDALYDSSRQSLYEDRRYVLNRYRYHDTARKVVGVGSVGTRAWVSILTGRGLDDPLMLQMKEANESVFERFVGRSPYATHGERVVQGQKLIQSTADVLLGWASFVAEDGRPRDYYVRQFWNGKGSIDIDHLNALGLSDLGRMCAWCLAHAHARTGDSVAIANYLGGTDEFDQAIAAFAQAYAEQNEEDYSLFRKLIKKGELPCSKKSGAKK